MQYINSEGLLIDTIKNESRICGITNILSGNAVALLGKSNTVGASSLTFMGNNNTVSSNSVLFGGQYNNVSDSFLINGAVNNLSANSILLGGTGNTLISNSLSINGLNNYIVNNGVAINTSNSKISSDSISFFDTNDTAQNKTLSFYNNNSQLSSSLALYGNNNVVKNSIDIGGSNNILNSDALNVLSDNSVVSTSSVNILGQTNSLSQKGIVIMGKNTTSKNNGVAINTYNSSLDNRAYAVLEDESVIQSNSIGLGGNNNVLRLSSLSINTFNSRLTDNSFAAFTTNSVVSSGSISIGKSDNVNLQVNSLGIYNTNSTISSNSVSINNIDSTLRNNSLGLISNNAKVSSSSIEILGINNVVGISSIDILGRGNIILNQSISIKDLKTNVTDSVSIKNNNGNFTSNSVAFNGLNNTASNSSVVLAGSGINASNTSVGINGLNNTASNSSVVLAGSAINASNSSVTLAGSAINASNSSVGINGLKNTVSNSSVVLAGSAINASNSSVGIVGLNNSSTNSSVVLAGSGINASNSSVVLAGSSINASNTSVGINGLNNTVSNSSVVLAGSGINASNTSVGINGLNNTVSNSSVVLAGSAINASNSSVGINGLNNTVSNSSVGIVGLNNSSTNSSVTLAGSAINASNSSVVLAGSGINASNTSVGIVGLNNSSTNSSVVLAGSAINASNSSVTLAGSGINASNTSVGINGLNNTVSNSSVVLAGSAINASNSSVGINGLNNTVSNSSVGIVGLNNSSTNSSVVLAGSAINASNSSVVLAGSAINASNSSVVLNSTNSIASLSSLIISGRDNIVNNNSMGLGSNKASLLQNRSLAVGGDSITLNASDSLAIGARNTQGSGQLFNANVSGTNIVIVGGENNVLGSNAVSVGGKSNILNDSSVFIGGSGNNVGPYKNVTMINVKDVYASESDTAYLPRSFFTGNVTVRGNVSASGNIMSIDTLITTEWAARLVNYLQPSAVLYLDQRNNLGNYNIAEFHYLGSPKMYVTRQGVGINTSSVPAPYVLTINGKASGQDLVLNNQLTFGAADLNGYGDTNLYRSAANTLKTDDDLVVAGRVGVGVSSFIDSQTRLHVRGTVANDDSSVLIENTDQTGYSSLAFGSARDQVGLWRNGNLNTQYAGASSLNLGTIIPSNVGIVTNNSTRMFISSGGNVGIGTSNPTARLDVNGQLKVATSWAGVLSAIGVGSGYADATNGVVRFYSENTVGSGGNVLKVDSAFANNTFIVKDNGRVGIGTDAPNQKLEVVGTGRFTSNGQTLDLVGSDHSYIGWYPDGVVAGRKGYTGYPGATTNSFWIANEINDGSGHVVLWPGANANVGISVAIPIEKLQVQGKVYIEGGSADWNVTTPGLARGSIHLDPGVPTDNFGSAITWGASDTANGENAQAGIYVRSDGTFGTKMYFATTDNYTLGSRTGMTIDSVGNVGIGVTTNLTAKLDVAGVAAVDYLRVDPQDTVNEGGEIQLIGAGSNGTVLIDNQSGNVRIHTLAAGKQFRVLGGSGIWTNSDITAEGDVTIGRTDISTTATAGSRLIFNGSNNTDNLSIYRYNVSSDVTELRVSIGDNVSEDSFVVGNLSWVDWMRVKATQTTIPGSLGVGVGVTTPTRQLHVKTTDLFVSRMESSNTNATVAELYNTSSNRIWENAVAGSANLAGVPSGGYYIQDQTAGATRLAINTSGNVGMGVVNADTKLTIGLASGGVSTIWQGGTDFLKLFATNSNFSEQAIVFQETGTNVGAKIGVKNTSNGAYDILFANRPGTSTTSAMAERMRITNVGRVGIGTTNPNYAFETVGIGGTQSRSVGIDIREIKFRGDNVAHFSIYGAETGESFLSIRNTSSGMTPGIAGTTLFGVHSNGNVAIGNTAFSAKLHVTGGTTADSTPEIQIDGSSGWIMMHNNSTAGSWNPLVELNDKSFIFSSGIIDGTAGLVIGPHSATSKGIKINSLGNLGIKCLPSTSGVYALTVNGEVLVNNGWLRTSGKQGWYSETYGGGWVMEDTSWIRTCNEKNVWTGSGLLGSHGGLTVGHGGWTPPSGGAIIRSSVGIGQGPTSTPNPTGAFTPGDNLEVRGGIIARNDTSEGGRIRIQNFNKTGGLINDWSIWNMTGGYGNGLVFWRYAANGTNVGPALSLHDDGRVGVGYYPHGGMSNAAFAVVGSIHAASRQDTAHAQGAYLEWNKDGGSGITYLLNQKGIGGGGIILGEIDNANGITERLKIDGSGRAIFSTPNGSAANPTVSVNPNNAGTPMGMYESGGFLRFGVAGGERFRIQSDGGCVGGYFYSNGRYYAAGSGGEIAINDGGYGSIFEQRSVDESGTTNNSHAAYMIFHRPGKYAVRFGLDTDNRLKVGGWSMTNAAYEIWHDGNASEKVIPAKGAIVYQTTAGTVTVSNAYHDRVITANTAAGAEVVISLPNTGINNGTFVTVIRMGDGAVRFDGTAIFAAPDATFKKLAFKNSIAGAIYVDGAGWYLTGDLLP